MFWKKNNIEPLSDLSALAVDIHSHLLPGLDDGSQSTEESVQIIEGLQKLGYKKLIITPHNQAGYFVNPPESIGIALRGLSLVLVENHIDIQIEAASEYFVDYDFLEMVNKKELITFGNQYVLIELSTNTPPPVLSSVIFEMQMNGYRPVLAHPERYSYWYNDIKPLYALKDREVLFQMNIHSLSDDFPVPLRRMAERLIKDNMVDLLGSDTHSYSNINVMRKLLSNKLLVRLVESGSLLNKQLL